MAKKMQIELPDEVFDDLANLAGIIKQQPEQVAVEWITTMVGAITGKAILSPISESTGVAPLKPGGRSRRVKRATAEAAPKKEGTGLVYRLKVTLRDSHPPIWRRIVVPGDITLARLHKVLQIVMGWEDYHLHQFSAAGATYGPKEANTGFMGLGVADERKVRLNQVAPEAGSRFGYEYDFGDDWQHQILVEKIEPPQEGVRYPVCITGKRACPPEDVGGIWSYEGFLESIRDPEDADHDELLEWVGGSFDPEAFDLEEVNKALEKVR